MSAATLEDSQLPTQAHTAPPQPGTDQAPAKDLDELQTALTVGTPTDQQEAGRAIVRFYVSQGAVLEGRRGLSGRVLAERHDWSGRWWRDRLGEVRAEMKAGTPARLTVVPNIDLDGTLAPAADAQNEPNPPSAGSPRATPASPASPATSGPAEPAASEDGSDGKQASLVAGPVAGPVAHGVASVASYPAPPLPPLPSAQGDGTDGSATSATHVTDAEASANGFATNRATPATPATPADLATAQHTARGPRATTRPAAHRSGPDAVDEHIAGMAGTAWPAEVSSPSRLSAEGISAHTALAAIELGNDRPAAPTPTLAPHYEPNTNGRGCGTGWPDRELRADEATRTPNLPTTATQQPSELPTAPPADPEPFTPDDARHSPTTRAPRIAEPTANPHPYAISLIAAVMAAWISTTQQTQQTRLALPRTSQPTEPRPVPSPPEHDQTDQHDVQRETRPGTVASPLPTRQDHPQTPLPPAENPTTAPLPRPEAGPVASIEAQPGTPAAALTLATAATALSAPTDVRAIPTEPVDDALATQTAPTAPASVARLAGGATAEDPPVTGHGAAMAGSVKLQYAFYGVASLFALIGQVWAALDHIPFPIGWPVLVRALVMAPALAVIELGGVATSHQADLRRRLGEQAYGYRALSFMAAAVAAGVNLLGHWGQWFPAVGFTGLSIFAYCSWLMQSAAQRRDTLRAAGQMATTAPVFGPIQWVLQPKLTWRSRTLAISESLGRTESLKLAEEQIRAEMRKRALVAMLRKVMKNQKKDANAARIALATIDYDRLAASLQERTNYDLWTNHFSADLIPPAPSVKPA